VEREQAYGCETAIIQAYDTADVILGLTSQHNYCNAFFSIYFKGQPSTFGSFEVSRKPLTIKTCRYNL
jgi:hypothetical protein